MKSIKILFFISFVSIISCFDGSPVGSIFNVVSVCRSSNTTVLNCLKQRALNLLDVICRSKEIQLIPEFVSLIGNDPVENRSAKFVPEEHNMDNTSALETMIAYKVQHFLESRSIKIQIPFSFLRMFSDVEEGRGGGGGGKKDKGGGMLAMGAMMAGGMMAMKMAAIAAIAGKALMASMMAMMLAAIAALSKKSSSHGSTYEVINVPGGHGHGHSRRSIPVDEYVTAKFTGQVPDEHEYDV